jgi:hypothetical protein
MVKLGQIYPGNALWNWVCVLLKLFLSCCGYERSSEVSCVESFVPRAMTFKVEAFGKWVAYFLSRDIQKSITIVLSRECTVYTVHEWNLQFLWIWGSHYIYRYLESFFFNEHIINLMCINYSVFSKSVLSLFNFTWFFEYTIHLNSSEWHAQKDLFPFFIFHPSSTIAPPYLIISILFVCYNLMNISLFPFFSYIF